MGEGTQIVTFGLVIIILVTVLAIFYFVTQIYKKVYGDDTEDTDLRNCLLGDKKFCDKIDINRLYDQLLAKAEQWNGDQKMCFENQTLADKFLEQHSDDGSHFKVTVPCPEYNATLQEELK